VEKKSGLSFKILGHQIIKEGEKKAPETEVTVVTKDQRRITLREKKTRKKRPIG